MRASVRSLFNNTKDAICDFASDPTDNLAYLIPVLIGLISIISGIVGYVKFVVAGGYTAQVDAIKAYGVFESYKDNFTIGSSGSITSGAIGKIILVLLIIEFILMMNNYFRATGKVKRIVMIVDFVILVIQTVLTTTVFWGAIGNLVISEEAAYEAIKPFKGMQINARTILITYAVISVVSIVTFFVLILTTKDCRWIVGNTVNALVIAYIVMPLLILLFENVIPLVAGAVSIVLTVVIFIGAVWFMILAILDGEGSAGGSSSSLSSSSRNGASAPNVKKVDNRPAYETDTNKNHYYIANFQGWAGVDLYKVHGSTGDYIELDNHITTRTMCSLEEAKSGKYKFFREENGKQINFEDIPWRSN